MSGTITPTYRFPVYTDITPAFLTEQGIRGILTDLDDTLTEHNCPTPDEKLIAWLKSVKEAGIPVCIVSNNTGERTGPFAREIGVGYLYNSLKPWKRALRIGLSVIGCKPEEALFIGDQLYTDIRGANNVGMRSALVEPVGNNTTAFIRFKRKLEQKYRKGGEKHE